MKRQLSLPDPRLARLERLEMALNLATRRLDAVLRAPRLSRDALTAVKHRLELDLKACGK
jgi:hypothetical protein